MLIDHLPLQRKAVLVMKRGLFCFVVTWICLLFSSVSGAHMLEETSAKVLLREGQVEIQILTNIEKWQTTLSSDQLWLLGDIEEVMPADLNAEGRAQFLQAVLLNQLELTINDQRVELSVELSPSLLASDHHQHAATIVLRGKLGSLVANNVSVVFPKSLGPVHVSFLRPQYRLAPAGQSVTVLMN